jgi:hypothetical protein
MEVSTPVLDMLSDSQPEAGMSVQLIQTPNGVVAVLSDGHALPCYADRVFYDLTDLLAGVPVPNQTRQGSIQALAGYPSRLAAMAAIAAGHPAMPTPPRVGASPLLVRRKLQVPTAFYRYISSNKDHRYKAGKLSLGTYLTTRLETAIATSGFAAVGRFALPLPIPTTQVIEYSLPTGTDIDVGTVAPLFGQSGGGVEVCLVNATSAVAAATLSLPEF